MSRQPPGIVPGKMDNLFLGGPLVRQVVPHPATSAKYSTNFTSSKVWQKLTEFLNSTIIDNFDNFVYLRLKISFN
ncbi:MAG: hypothetical protein BWK78_02950 [Thiotrichaceae bacterium IS1]|nr:MAG: hypothetical protein BWK78_02950 [Thiotrichaceae bacterium IS1]